MYDVLDELDDPVDFAIRSFMEARDLPKALKLIQTIVTKREGTWTLVLKSLQVRLTPNPNLLKELLDMCYQAAGAVGYDSPRFIASVGRALTYATKAIIQYGFCFEFATMLKDVPPGAYKDSEDLRYCLFAMLGYALMHVIATTKATQLPPAPMQTTQICGILGTILRIYERADNGGVVAEHLKECYTFIVRALSSVDGDCSERIRKTVLQLKLAEDILQNTTVLNYIQSCREETIEPGHEYRQRLKIQRNYHWLRMVLLAQGVLTNSIGESIARAEAVLVDVDPKERPGWAIDFAYHLRRPLLRSHIIEDYGEIECFEAKWLRKALENQDYGTVLNCVTRYRFCESEFRHEVLNEILPLVYGPEAVCELPTEVRLLLGCDLLVSSVRSNETEWRGRLAKYIEDDFEHLFTAALFGAESAKSMVPLSSVRGSWYLVLRHANDYPLMRQIARHGIAHLLNGCLELEQNAGDKHHTILHKQVLAFSLLYDARIHGMFPEYLELEDSLKKLVNIVQEEPEFLAGGHNVALRDQLILLIADWAFSEADVSIDGAALSLLDLTKPKCLETPLIRLLRFLWAVYVGHMTEAFAILPSMSIQHVQLRSLSYVLKGPLVLWKHANPQWSIGFEYFANGIEPNLLSPAFQAFNTCNFSEISRILSGYMSLIAEREPSLPLVVYIWNVWVLNSTLRDTSRPLRRVRSLAKTIPMGLPDDCSLDDLSIFVSTCRDPPPTVFQIFPSDRPKFHPPTGLMRFINDYRSLPEHSGDVQWPETPLLPSQHRSIIQAFFHEDLPATKLNCYEELVNSQPLWQPDYPRIFANIPENNRPVWKPTVLKKCIKFLRTVTKPS